MDHQELQQKILALVEDMKALKESDRQKKEKIQQLETVISHHEHAGDDGSKILTRKIRLDKDQSLKLADSEIIQKLYAVEQSNERNMLLFSTGRDSRDGLQSNSNNIQLNLVHQPASADRVSWFDSYGAPIYTNGSEIGGQTISVTSGGSTISVKGLNLETDILTGCWINIYDSTGLIVETQRIASNTSDVITITGTWINTTNNGFYLLYAAMLLGSTDAPWRRAYVHEGTYGGVRFGVAGTNAGQNGLLYMDAAGDLYWRNKSGTSVKLN